MVNYKEYEMLKKIYGLLFLSLNVYGASQRPNFPEIFTAFGMEQRQESRTRPGSPVILRQSLSKKFRGLLYWRRF